MASELSAILVCPTCNVTVGKLWRESIEGKLFPDYAQHRVEYIKLGFTSTTKHCPVCQTIIERRPA